jgi:hypothetical protein
MSFIDAPSGEVLLRVTSDPEGEPMMEYRLYDANGSVVKESRAPTRVKKGLTVRCPGGELLLDVPPNNEQHVSYRLYNKNGHLLTFSDGSRTMIYGELRMENSRV